MNPNGMKLEDLLKLLDQSGGSASPSSPASPAAPTAASITGSTAGATGNAAGTLLNPLFGINTGAASSEGGSIGGGIGSLIGALFGPLGSSLGGFGGGLLGDLLGGAIGGGISNTAKSQSIVGALDTSGNSLDALIGKFLGPKVGAGNVLSESGSSTLYGATQRLAAMLEALTGQKAPGVTGSGFQNNPSIGFSPLGGAADKFKLPAGYEFATDPSKYGDILSVLKQVIGGNASGIAGRSPQSQEEWQRVLRELIQKGDLQKYQGPLGAAGGGNTSGGAIPNVSLPHPLAATANPAVVPSPYSAPSGYQAAA